MRYVYVLYVCNSATATHYLIAKFVLYYATVTYMPCYLKRKFLSISLSLILLEWNGWDYERSWAWDVKGVEVLNMEGEDNCGERMFFFQFSLKFFKKFSFHEETPFVAKNHIQWKRNWKCLFVWVFFYVESKNLDKILRLTFNWCLWLL